MKPVPGVMNRAPRLLRKTLNGVPPGAFAFDGGGAVAIDLAMTAEEGSWGIAVVWVTQSGLKGGDRPLDRRRVGRSSHLEKDRGRCDRLFPKIRSVLSKYPAVFG
jgi:hypothetical protein